MPTQSKAHTNIKQAKAIDGIFSFVNQFHSFNSRQIDRHIVYTDYFKDTTFWKK